MVTLKEITKKTLFPILKLDVLEHQKDQVAPNSISISEAYFEDKAWFRGIYNDDVPVGFVMLSLDTDKKEYWVWRYMIDKNHQGKGYGKDAMELVKKVIKEKFPDAMEFFLSYVPKEKDGADGFYRKLGFVDTGKMEDGEKIMRFGFA